VFTPLLAIAVLTLLGWAGWSLLRFVRRRRAAAGGRRAPAWR
jgi:hypothetical protein